MTDNKWRRYFLGDSALEARVAAIPVTHPAWTEYDACARDLVHKGLTGAIGDPLPNLISAECNDLIQYDPEAFQQRVKDSAYALAMA
jgi:hypothetical protein